MHYGSYMSTITLKNVPAGIHRGLKARAKTNGRSLNKEIITVLEQTLNSAPDTASAIAGRRERCAKAWMSI